MYKKNAKQWIKHCCVGEDCCMEQKKKSNMLIGLVTAWTNLDKNKKFWKAKSKEEINICKRKYTVDVAISASFWKKPKTTNWSLIEMLYN